MRKAVPYAGALLVPAVAGTLLWRWADRSLRSPHGLPTVLALVGGLALTAVALLAHNALFREGGGIAAVVLLLAGLTAVWVEARDSAVLGAVTDCVVVGEVRVTHHPTFGEGAPAPKTLYHHTLDCVGGYPAEFSAEERIAGPGGAVRIAYDPDRRMDPVLARDNESHGSPVIPTSLLVLSAALSVTAIAREGDGEGRGEGRRKGLSS
ncbi:hypothetical protein EDD98_1366 [Streptomyces sp. PanSC19]|uniref:hypothetical protein n=1 Tax=Streptomyces sp. PanSC19 TaxID=1520455 RepID=UPI000F48D3CB|nr:hypothetical protein [Streptomyces sp. PanSC19]ROQ32383.1 hypothetical protein EDD98_1366 [Streptomyces sp. PanSC19]